MIPYFSATFSEVIPIGIRTFCAYSFSKVSSAKVSGLTIPSIANMDMDSTPPPIPISMVLEEIWAAIEATAYNPDEQSLLIAYWGVVCGIPARNWAALVEAVPAPPCRTLPTQSSWIIAGSETLPFFKQSLRTGFNIASGAVWHYGPFLALVMAVLANETITTSLSSLAPTLPALKEVAVALLDT